MVLCGSWNSQIDGRDVCGFDDTLPEGIFGHKSGLDYFHSCLVYHLYVYVCRHPCFPNSKFSASDGVKTSKLSLVLVTYRKEMTLKPFPQMDPFLPPD